MAYDVYYFSPNGRRQAGFDRCVNEYNTKRRNDMLREDGDYAAACWIDHPARPWFHWNGRAWVDGPFIAEDHVGRR